MQLSGKPSLPAGPATTQEPHAPYADAPGYSGWTPGSNLHAGKALNGDIERLGKVRPVLRRVFGQLTRLARTPVTAARHQFRCLDLLRGLAALSVIIFHFKNFTRGGGDLSRAPIVLDQVHLLSWLSYVREYGSAAVMFFWMLSGFVLMNTYANTKPRTRAFWVKRIARLYPLHFLTLLTVAVIQIAAQNVVGHSLIFEANDGVHFARQLLLASAWTSDKTSSFNGPIWSVSVEVLIYATFLAYCRMVRNNLATSVVGMLGFAIIVRLTHGATIAACGQYFFGGMTVYAVFELCGPPRLGRLLIAAAAMFSLSALVGMKLGSFPWMPASLWTLPLFGGLIAIVASAERMGMLEAFGRASAVGEITYSSYLWHSPLQMLFLLGAGLGLWSVDVAFNDSFFVCYILTVCALSWLSFRFIERPAQRLVKNALLNPIRQPAAASA